MKFLRGLIAVALLVVLVWFLFGRTPPVGRFQIITYTDGEIMVFDNATGRSVIVRQGRDVETIIPATPKNLPDLRRY